MAAIPWYNRTSHITANAPNYKPWKQPKIQSTKMHSALDYSIRSQETDPCLHGASKLSIATCSEANQNEQAHRFDWLRTVGAMIDDIQTRKRDCQNFSATNRHQYRWFTRRAYVCGSLQILKSKNEHEESDIQLDIENALQSCVLPCRLDYKQSAPRAHTA